MSLSYLYTTLIRYAICSVELGFFLLLSHFVEFAVLHIAEKKISDKTATVHCTIQFI